MEQLVGQLDSLGDEGAVGLGSGGVAMPLVNGVVLGVVLRVEALWRCLHARQAAALNVLDHIS